MMPEVLGPSLGPSHVRKLDEDNSQDASSIRAPASPPRASSARPARAVGVVGLQSGIPRLSPSSSAEQLNAPTMGDLEGGWRKARGGRCQGPAVRLPEGAHFAE